MGDPFEAALLDVTPAPTERLDPVFGKFFREGVAVGPGEFERRVLATVAFVGEEFRVNFTFERDPDEPPVVAFVRLVDAADAVVKPEEFHAINDLRFTTRHIGRSFGKGKRWLRVRRCFLGGC
jgi:hypothetical protein